MSPEAPDQSSPLRGSVAPAPETPADASARPPAPPDSPLDVTADCEEAPADIIAD
ncbi:MAG: hypothetical protein LUQ69_01785 [Methanoregulaceae archaeon]|nr:hypothetical protein [Methanoregulaceae archaeon]